jgi:DNA-binding winged helix-turn-helix (wHTH) protein
MAMTATTIGPPLGQARDVDLDPAEAADADGIWIDGDGLLHRAGRWVALPDIEWRMLELLVASLDRLVRRDDLAAAGWPDRVIPSSALNVRINLARQRLAPLDLVITTVRGRGYVLSRRGG